MKFSDFLTTYDYKGSIVLLEGKREVLESDKLKLVKLGELLTSLTKNILFRSGGAKGADCYFSVGVSNVDINRLEIILPFNGFRKTSNKNCRSISLESIDLFHEEEVVLQSKMNKKTQRLIDLFVGGSKNHISMRGAFIIRDTIKVLGTKSEIPPATVGCFYDNLDKPATGGTGHTMGICLMNNIPFFNQTEWLEWIQ